MTGWRNSNDMFYFILTLIPNYSVYWVWLPIDNVQYRKLMLTEELAYATTTCRSEKKCYFLRGVRFKVHPWSLEKLSADLIYFEGMATMLACSSIHNIRQIKLG